MGSKNILSSVGGALVLACLCAASCATAVARDPIPQVSPEGMRLQQSKDARIVYKRDGVDFGKYRQFKLLDAHIAFEKNWQRQYNRDHVGMQRVRDEDMERLKKELSSEFRRIFEAELVGGGYELTNEQGPGVLVLQPDIADLVVTAPDLKVANMNTVIRSAGAMTLHLELHDGASNEILARIIDRQAEDEDYARVATRISNKAAANDILEDWAKKLRSQLDAARASNPVP
ncbi:MAG TPA: DUF3313 family protein [Thermomonas sp.]|nr:DUF3313 family protein [Thermomonas sp.]